MISKSLTTAYIEMNGNKKKKYMDESLSSLQIDIF